jgi:hypothetical protein
MFRRNFIKSILVLPFISILRKKKDNYALRLYRFYMKRYNKIQEFYYPMRYTFDHIPINTVWADFYAGNSEHTTS